MRERLGRVEQELKTANAEHLYKVDRSMLPLHCPLPGSYLWNSHPKVYLPIEQTGEAKCPYCGANYELVENAS
ncbi:MAG TPA: zinc-finger domain-containing protein [Gammaproteobacteria bacterium]